MKQFFMVELFLQVKDTGKVEIKLFFRKGILLFSDDVYEQFLDEAMDKCGEQYGFW